MEHISYLSDEGTVKINATIWRPEGKPRGIVQIIHGMCEYGERYAPFAEFLASKGFLVGAEDHLGHGKSVKSEEDLGFFCDGDASDVVLRDIRRLSVELRAAEPDAPFFVLGHSMGSFFCRRLMAEYGAEYSGAVVMGTGYQSGFLTGTAIALTRLVALFRGWHKKSGFIKSVAFGSYNKRCRPVRTDKDWLSQDIDNVDRYIADPLCGFDFTLEGYLTLFHVVRDACSKKTFRATPLSLPVLIVSGSEDPVGSYGEGVRKVYEKYDDAGLEDVQMTIYREARHEILNDLSRVQVWDDVLGFFESHMV